MERSATVDEYYMTAHHIFDCCGADSTGLIRVDELMDKFAPFVKSNRAEYTYLRALLDPDQENREINLSNLAGALAKYSKSQKVKVDLDESFNIKGGQGPFDSDSGISSDGFQQLEDLQTELREKAHLANQLRSQLDFTNRQHEEVVASLTAERDSLRTHLKMLREENVTLTHVKRDYEETCDRLCGSERAVDELRREADVARRRIASMADQLADLENENLTLQELLSNSKDECHRINEMYSQRQATLLEEAETLRSERALLAATLHEHDQYMQQTFKEKVLLEMELKDVLNKSNQTQLRMDKSIDISYTEEQMLTALDSINSDSRFSQDNQILDEESFTNAVKEDQGKLTSMSLFDEMRLSFCNMSRNNTDFFNSKECTRCNEMLDTSLTTTGTQTDEGFNENAPYNNNNNGDICKDCTKFTMNAETQIDATNFDTCIIENKDQFCADCQKLNSCKEKLENDLILLQSTISEMQANLEQYEANLDVLEKFVKKENEKNNFLQLIVDSLKRKIANLEVNCADQKNTIDSIGCETCSTEMQTDYDVASTSVQVDTPCFDCLKRATAPRNSLTRYFWESLKCLFQLFAVVCFLCAVAALYGVTQRWRARCSRDAGVPWTWITAHDLMDLFFRIEYIADVPM